MNHQEFIRQIRPDLRQQKRKQYQKIPNPLISRLEYDKKVRFWADVLTEYSWHRCSLSLSEIEISNCFHLEHGDTKKIIKYMLKTNQIRLFQNRYIFLENVRRLNRITREEWNKSSYLTIYELQKMTIYKFLVDKHHNQDIIQQCDEFFLELKYKDNVLHGARARD